jgi:putative ATP-binding cassette transporter
MTAPARQMHQATARATVPDLLRFLYRQTAGERLRIVVPSIASGLARGALLAAFNEAASRAGKGGLDIGLLGIFAGCLLLYLVSSYASAVASDRLVRHLLHRLRLSISEKLIHAPLRLVEAQDPGKIFTLIGHESESLANVAKDFIVTFQAAIVLAFALAYLAWLSVPSFLLSLLIIALGAGA